MFVQWTERYSTVEKECLASARLQSPSVKLFEREWCLTNLVELITATLCVFTIQYANSVFKALRIETEEDVHKLVKFFIRKAEGKSTRHRIYPEWGGQQLATVDLPKRGPPGIADVHRAQAWVLAKRMEVQMPSLVPHQTSLTLEKGEVWETRRSHILATFAYVLTESGLNYTK